MPGGHYNGPKICVTLNWSTILRKGIYSTQINSHTVNTSSIAMHIITSDSTYIHVTRHTFEVCSYSWPLPWTAYGAVPWRGRESQFMQNMGALFGGMRRRKGWVGGICLPYLLDTENSEFWGHERKSVKFDLTVPRPFAIRAIIAPYCIHFKYYYCWVCLWNTIISSLTFIELQ